MKVCFSRDASSALLHLVHQSLNGWILVPHVHGLSPITITITITTETKMKELILSRIELSNNDSALQWNCEVIHYSIIPHSGDELYYSTYARRRAVKSRHLDTYTVNFTVVPTPKRSFAALALLVDHLWISYLDENI